MVNNLQNILEKYAKYSIGLFFLDPPTGFGKTRAILDFMYQEYLNAERHIIFLTDLKKNLPSDEFRQRFFADTPSVFERDVLFLDAYSAHLIRLFKEKLIENIKIKMPSELLASEEFRQLEREISNYLDFETNPNLKERFAKSVNDAESNFRKKLKGFIKDFGDKPIEKLEKIKKNHTWLIELYPSVLVREKRVLFMSVDKFLYHIDPIYDRPFTFFDENKGMLKDALLVIDECDASKDVLIKHTIESNLQKKVDIINLFNTIHSALGNRELPASVLEDSTMRQKRLAKWHLEEVKLTEEIASKKASKGSANEAERKLAKIQERIERAIDIPKIIEKMKKELQEIEQKVKIPYTIKVANPSKDRRFLFYDWRYHTVVRDEDKRYIGLKRDDKERRNEIVFLPKSDKDSTEFLPLIGYMNRIEGFISLFARNAWTLAANYRDNRNEDNINDNEEEFSEHNSLQSVLSLFQITDEKQQAYLIEKAQSYHRARKKKATKTAAEKTRSYYDTGYSYFAFEDSDTHALQSKIYVSTFPETPESQLATWAEQAMVVGVSATAKLPTVVGNYDLTYLIDRLGETYQEMTAEERDLLRGEYEKRFPNFEEKVNLETDFIGVQAGLETELLELFDDKEIVVNRVMTQIESDIQSEEGDDEYGDNVNFKIRRLLQLAKTFDRFVAAKDVTSFLCFLNIHPKKDSKTLPLSIVNAIFDKILIKHGLTNEDVKWDVLKSDNFEADKKQLLSQLTAGKKLFIMTTYRTLGAGQNVQYKPSTAEGLVDLFQFEGVKTADREKDFDGIYLEKPTHLLVNLNSKELNELPEQKRYAELNKRVCQVEALHERGYITAKQLKFEVNRAFHRIFQPFYKDIGTFKPRNLYDTTDFHYLVIRAIIQAVGRIGRTGLKNPHILILADANLAPHLTQFDTEGSIYSPEFLALCRRAHQEPLLNVEETVEPIKERAQSQNLKGWIWIHSKIKTQWAATNDRKDWQDLRRFVLQNPTLSTQNWRKSDFRWAYIELPKAADRYFYFAKEDFKETLIFFEKPPAYAVSLSEKAINLPKFMEMPDLKKYFEEQDFATQWQTGDYILSPVVFNNIYKGALGEEIGKWVFSKHLPELPLLDMPTDQFERFDYQIGQNTEGSFVDFKLWQEARSQTAAAPTHAHIRNKMTLTKASKVVIANIAADGVYPPILSQDKRILEVPRLIDLATQSVDFEAIKVLKSFLNSIF